MDHANKEIRQTDTYQHTCLIDLPCMVSYLEMDLRITLVNGPRKIIHPLKLGQGHICIIKLILKNFKFVTNSSAYKAV